MSFKGFNSFKNKFIIFGILNVTPDSFSDGGDFVDVNVAVNRGLEMIKEGADVIDIGGMSTRPGFSDVPVEEEINRIVPVIKGILEKSPNAIISVDTFRSVVAKAALDAGALIINDVSGLDDIDMASVVAQYDAGLVLMRNGFDMSMSGFEEILNNSLERAYKAGIRTENIILDPGVGFTETRDEDLMLINSIPDIIDGFNLPVLLGVSRKRITGTFYPIQTVAKERDGASIALAILGFNLGATALRVHDVKQTVGALRAWTFAGGI
ncbi:MAG: dihydropteroate synthase [Saccharofermentans sp.]|nr:dihydropteroate synthase [Saccharofermentans sp.]